MGYRRIATSLLGLALLGASAGAAEWSQRLQGRWDEGRDFGSLCGADANLHTQTLSPDGKTLSFGYQKPIKIHDGRQVTTYAYQVRETAPDSLTLSVAGETRKTSAGEPVVWQMVFVDLDTYRWRATADPPGVFMPVWGRRCK